MCRHTLTKTTTKTAAAAKVIVSKEEDSDSGLGADLDTSLELAFRLVQEERAEKLRARLRGFLRAAVLPLVAASLGLDAGSVVEVPEETLEEITAAMVQLGEQEPYGIDGGTLLVHWGSEPRHLEAGADCEAQQLRGVARAAVSPRHTPTHELHLTLLPSARVQHRVANLVRRFQAKPPVLVTDQRFKLTKKKLYRS